MNDTCSLCGSDKDVEYTGDIYMCASCRGEKPEAIARLKFARWAVEHGKISDFPGKVDELCKRSSKDGKR